MSRQPLQVYRFYRMVAICIGFGTGIPQVGFSHTVPEPGNTVPGTGTGTYHTVKLAVSYRPRGTLGTRGFFSIRTTILILLLYLITIKITTKDINS